MAEAFAETTSSRLGARAGSLETLDFIAQRKYSYMGIPFFHIDVFRRQFGLFREACERAGYTASDDQLGWAIPVYVAETDEQARRELNEQCGISNETC